MIESYQIHELNDLPIESVASRLSAISASAPFTRTATRHSPSAIATTGTDALCAEPTGDPSTWS